MENTNLLAATLIIIGVLGLQVGLYEILIGRLDPLRIGIMLIFGSILIFAGAKSYVAERKLDED